MCMYEIFKACYVKSIVPGNSMNPLMLLKYVKQVNAIKNLGVLFFEVMWRQGVKIE